MDDKKKSTTRVVFISFENTDNVSHQNFFIWLPKHAGQNDMFLF